MIPSPPLRLPSPELVPATIRTSTGVAVLLALACCQVFARIQLEATPGKMAQRANATVRSETNFALQFDGLDDYLSCSGCVRVADIGAAVTIEGRIRWDGSWNETRNRKGWIFGLRNSFGLNIIEGEADQGRAKLQVLINDDSDDQSPSVIREFNSGAAFSLDGNDHYILADQWHHVAITFEQLGATSVQSQLFIDGQRISQLTYYDSFDGLLDTSGSKSMEMGKTQTWSNRYFPGTLDEIAVSSGVVYRQNFSPPSQPYPVRPFSHENQMTNLYLFDEISALFNIGICHQFFGYLYTDTRLLDFGWKNAVDAVATQGGPQFVTGFPAYTSALEVMPALEAQCLGGSCPDLTAISGKSHPFLLFDEQDRAQQEVKIAQEPFASWYTAWTKYGKTSQDTSYVDLTKKSGWNYRVFAYIAVTYQFTTDEGLRSQALAKLNDLLDQMDAAGMATGFSSMDTQQEVQPGIYAAIVYDMIADAPTTDVAQTKKDLLAGFLSTLAQNQVTEALSDDWARLNPDSNHQHRGATLVSLIGIVLKDQHLLNTGLQYLERAFSEALSSDGVWDHGLSYTTYGVQNFLTLALIYERLFAINLLQLSQPAIGPMLDAILKQRRPDGYHPNYDDAFTDGLMNHKAAYALLEHPGFHKWHLEEVGNPDLNDTNLLDILFFFYDQSIASQAPDWNPTQFLEDENIAIFRNSWEQDSSWLILQGENHVTSSHANHDQTHFSLFAHGALLALDPGYAGWGRRSNPNASDYIGNYTIPADAHNTITVMDADGLVSGPVDAPKSGSCPEGYPWSCRDFDYLDRARFSHTHSAPFLDQAQLRVAYGYTGEVAHSDNDQVDDVVVTRTLLFPKESDLFPPYFVVIDDIQADTSYTYQWNLHGPSQRYSQDGNAHVWVTETFDKLFQTSPIQVDDGNPDNDRELRLYIQGTQSGSATTLPGMHFYSEDRDEHHTHLQVSQNHVADTQFIAVLYPRRTLDMDAPVVTPLSGSLNARGFSLTVFANGNQRDDEMFTKNQAGTAAIGRWSADADQAFIHRRNGSAHFYAFYNGSSLSFAGLPLLSATQNIQAFNLEFEGYTGHMQLEQESEISFYSPAGILLSTRTFSAGTHRLDPYTIGLYLDIPDPALKARLLDLYDSSGEGELDMAEAATILDLDCSNRLITNLEGMQHFTNLVSLDASGNALSSLPDLSALTQLTDLNLSANQLVQVDGLRVIPNLILLDLSQNQLAQCPDLNGLTQLQQLNLTYNPLQQLPVLPAALTHLRLGHCLLENLNDLGSLPNLVTLDLAGNRLSQVSGLDTLTHLAWLDLSHNRLNHIAALMDNSSLGTQTGHWIDLRRNLLSDTDCDPLTQLQHRVDSSGATLHYNPQGNFSLLWPKLPQWSSSGGILQELVLDVTLGNDTFQLACP